MQACKVLHFGLVGAAKTMISIQQLSLSMYMNLNKSVQGHVYIQVINHTLLSPIRAVISTLTCMASNSMSGSECY